MATKIRHTDKDDNLFLPHFCEALTVFWGVVVTELLAFVFVLVPLSKTDYDWNYVEQNLITDLAMVSLFLQWITLVSMALLCLFRRWLRWLNHNIVVGLISYLLILMVTGGVSELAWQFNEYMLSTELTWSTTPHQLFLWRNLGISAIISAIVLRYFYIQYLWKTETEALASARAQALQARIRPHFLFNSMNTIASLIRFQPEKAEQAVVDFAQLFRASLADVKTGCVTFQEEVTLCQQYLRLEVLRFGERLQVVWEIDNIPENALLPPLCLQPLLENAIYHGIQPLPEGGTITVIGLFEGKYIRLDIKNPFVEAQSTHKGNRIAQHNIYQRLQVFFGKEAKLTVQKHADTYQIIIRFPYRNQEDEHNYR